MFELSLTTILRLLHCLLGLLCLEVRAMHLLTLLTRTPIIQTATQASHNHISEHENASKRFQRLVSRWRAVVYADALFKLYLLATIYLRIQKFARPDA